MKHARANSSCRLGVSAAKSAVTRGASPVPGTKRGDGYGVGPGGWTTVKSVTDVAEAWSLLASASVTVTASA